MVDYTVEFVNSLALTPIELMTVDTSNLFGDASTINVVRTQTGASDTPIAPSSNVIIFDPLTKSGTFSIQHDDFNSGNPVTLDINNVDVILQDHTTGISPVYGPSAVYTINVANGPPNANYLWLVYQGDTINPMTIKYDGTDVIFHGHIYSSMQAALDGYFGAGVWIVEGSPQDATFTFSKVGTSFGTSPWAVDHDYWASVGHAVTDSFVDGSTTVNQKFTLTFDGVPTTGSVIISFQGVYLMTIPYNGTNIMFNGGGPYATIQECLDSVINPYISGYGSHGGGPWTATGVPADGTIVFTGGTTPVGQAVWAMNSENMNVGVIGTSIDGLVSVAGTRAQHLMYIDGAFNGTFTINGGSAIPWNVTNGDLLSAFNSEVAIVNQISGSGTIEDPWIITYQEKQPQGIPSINASNLSGFTTEFLQYYVGSSFVVTKDQINSYTITSATNGSGQNAIIVNNIDMIAGVDIIQPVTKTAGSAGTGGLYATYQITLASVPASGHLTINYSGIIFDIQINYDNTDQNGDTIQTRMNNIGLGGWTYSGSPSSQTITFTRNSQEPYGINPWSVSLNTFSNGGLVMATLIFTDGAYPTGTAQCVQTWVSPSHQGVTGGTYFLTAGESTVGPINFDLSVGELSTYWASVTGHGISWSTGFGTNLAPYEFHFAENLAIDLPNVDASLLIKDGTVNNEFTDGISTGGQSEIQTVELADSPNNGYWSITLDDNTLDPLDFNIAENDLQAALRSVWNNNQITVTGNSPYQITFGDHATKNLITANGSNLKKSVVATITRIKSGQNIPN